MIENQADEIKNRLDLVEFIRGYMKLEKSGVNFRGLCPFHHEKTPSLFVSPTRQIWKCFGCGVGGDIFTFIEQIEGVEFKEALQTLAERAGVALRSFDPRTRSEKARLYEVCEKAAQFFEKQLNTSTFGSEAKDYLLGRGLETLTMTKFRLGFAPNTRDSLLRFLRMSGYSPAEVFKSGLSIQPDDAETYASGSPYDRFRGRIIFPIFDINGQVIGFGGRVFFTKNQIPDDKLAKYINTPQTLLYDKSRILYGLDKAKLSIREKDSVIVVEGYMDLIMCHQSGETNSVAVSGTSLTTQQLDLIKRYADNIITCFDMDVAGDSATKRGIDLAQARGFNIKVLTLPEGKDPAEIIQKDVKKWKDVAEKPLSIGDFYFENAFSKYDIKTEDGRKNISKILLSMIRNIPTQIEQSFWIQKLSSKLNCAESVIWHDLKNVNTQSHKDKEHKRETGLKVTRPRTKREKLYAQLLFTCVKTPSAVLNIKARDLNFFSSDSLHSNIIIKIRDYLGSARKSNGKAREPFNLLNNIRDTRIFTIEEKDVLNEIAFQNEVYPAFADDTDYEDEFNLCLQSLKRDMLREKLNEIHGLMKTDSNNNNLLKEFQDISSQLIKLENG